MAPSHELRQAVNGHIRERLARDGAIHGAGLDVERLVSYGYTSAEKSLAANYAPGDVVAFHRAYKSLGVEKGEERRVARVDHARGTVILEGRDGETVHWQPRRVGGRRGAVEVYRAEGIELRAGDRIRWTRNDARLGLVNSHTAEVASVRGSRVAFRLEDGRRLELEDPQLRHLDHAWASTVHAFQGRTVDNVIAVMEANHPHLTTQKSFYVEISRARHRAELVTDDARALRERLETATGELSETGKVFRTTQSTRWKFSRRQHERLGIPGEKDTTSIAIPHRTLHHRSATFSDSLPVGIAQSTTRPCLGRRSRRTKVRCAAAAWKNRKIGLSRALRESVALLKPSSPLFH